MNAENIEVRCPYCGESIHILVDTSAGEQRQTEDCQVCCRLIDLNISIDAEKGINVTAARDDA